MKEITLVHQKTYAESCLKVANKTKNSIPLVGDE
jgi:hypothetical protein